MSATNSTQWFWSDWAGDREVRRLTPAERGLWIDLLAFAAAGNPVGYVVDQQGSPISYEEIARFTNATPTEVATLVDGILKKGAASKDRTGRLFNRRMVRKAELSAKRKRIGKSGGEATSLRWQALQNLAGQNARQLVGDRVRSPSKSKNITTSSSEPAREAEPVETPQGAGNGCASKPPPLVASAELVASLKRH